MSLIQQPTQQKQVVVEKKQENQTKEHEDDWNNEDDSPGKAIIKIDATAVKQKAPVEQPNQFASVGWEQEQRMTDAVAAENLEGIEEPVVQEKSQPEKQKGFLNLNFRDREAGKAANNEGHNLDNSEFFALGEEPPKKQVTRQTNTVVENEGPRFKFTGGKIGEGREKPLEMDMATKKFLEQDNSIIKTYKSPVDPAINAPQKSQVVDDGKFTDSKGIQPVFSSKTQTQGEEQQVAQSQFQLQQEEAERRAEEQAQALRESVVLTFPPQEVQEPTVESQSSAEKPGSRFQNSKKTSDGPVEKPLEQVKEVLIVKAPTTTVAEDNKSTTHPTTVTNGDSNTGQDKPKIPMFSNKQKNDENFMSLEQALKEAPKQVEPELVLTPIPPTEDSKNDDQKKNNNRNNDKIKRKTQKKTDTKEKEGEEQAVEPTQENNQDGEEEDEGWNEVGGDEKQKQNPQRKQPKSKGGEKQEKPAKTEGAQKTQAPAVVNAASATTTQNGTDKGTAKIVVSINAPKTWDD